MQTDGVVLCIALGMYRAVFDRFISALGDAVSKQLKLPVRIRTTLAVSFLHDSRRRGQALCCPSLQCAWSLILLHSRGATVYVP